MYKHKNKIRLEQSKRPVLWLKRKVVLLLTAFMLGMANGMHADNQAIKGNQNYTEQHKKD
jgi:hypothetical protein